LAAFFGKSLLRAKYQSDLNQIFTKCLPVHEKYGKVVKLTKNKIMEELFRKILNRGTVTLLSCTPAGFKLYL
jgi:hypothetical protein